MNNGYNRNQNGRQIPNGGQRRPVSANPQRPAPQGGQRRPSSQGRPAGVQGRPVQQPQRGASPRQAQQPQMGRPASQARPAPQRRVDPARAKAEKERAAAQRRSRMKSAGRVFLGRLALYGIMLVVLLGITAGTTACLFFRTPDDNEFKITYYENYSGERTVKNKASGEAAYRNGVLYLDFSRLADGCGMTVITDTENAKFVIANADDLSDSSGTGKEEYVTFVNGGRECVVCGQSFRLSAPAVFEGKTIWVPAEFVGEYMNGITVEEDKDGGKVYITREKESEDEDAPVAEVSFKLKSTTAPEPTEPSEDVGAMPEVSFTNDLSEYEKYMNPSDASPYLKLVNKTTTVDAGYTPANLTNISNTRKDGRATQKMQETAAKALDAMFIEMKAAGYTDVSVTSAYRSYEYQNQLYNTYIGNEMSSNPSLTKAQAQAIVDTYSAKPGTSEHQTGLCADLHNLSGADKAFANEAAYTWLCENAWKFGFILRFPEDKTDVTGYDFEPWHYRFVGREAAWEIHSRGLCLEEYLAN